MKKDFRQTSKRGAVAWLLQRISAVILFLLLLFHFVIYHFISQGKAITYQYIMARIKAYSLWFSVLQFLFLATALYHGLNGIWGVLEDYVSNKYWRLFWYSVIVTIGSVLFFIGVLTIVKIAYVKI